MDVWDYSINFSSEILVAAIVLIAAGVNVIIFNPLSADYNHTDKSLAAHLLGNHPDLNKQLASKQNTVSTKVVSESLFSQANASNSDLLATAGGQVLGATDELHIDDSGITKPNPDSIKSLAAQQVQVIETDAFDTVYTIAEECGVTPKTIRDSNGLDSNALKAGWFIVCPPVDGLVIQVNNPNLTLPDVADIYKADINAIIAKNGLGNAEDMVDVGGYLVIPGGTLPQVATASSAPAKKSSPSIPKSATIAGNHKFAAGYCTDYVARKVPGITWGGNANRWIANSKAHGATVDRNPVAGAILVTNENSRYGHVAYIESVDGDDVTISEWNYAGLYKKTVRTLDIDDSRIKGVIHP